MQLAALLLGLLVAAPASAQIEFPASWAGIWDMTTTDRNCGSTTVIDMFTEADTLCAGTAFDPGDETEFTCAGSIGDTSIDVSCSGSFEADGCTVTFSFIVTGTRSGDSYTGTETFSITYEGACGPVPDQCTESEVSGVRTGPPPPACASTPVTSSEWGRIKRIYR
jgi:hypothetical protein